MASEQLNKVIERIKSQPQNPSASMEQRRAGMERISERVPADVICEKVSAGGVNAEWIAAPGRGRRSRHSVSARRRLRHRIDQYASRDGLEDRARVQCSRAVD